MTNNDLISLKNVDCLKELELLNIAFNDKLKLRDNLDLIKGLRQLKTLVVIGTNFHSEDIADIKNQFGTMELISNFEQYSNFLRRYER